MNALEVEPRPAPASAWARSWPEVADAVRVSLPGGLTAGEAARRLRRFGPNRLRRRPPRSVVSILAAQFRSVIVALLAAASLASFLFREVPEGVSILTVLALNAAIGFAMELRAVRSMEALSRLGEARTRVRRGGALREVPAEALVPGDVVLVEGGDVVSADLRLVSASRLQVDESALTGESVPVDKDPEAVGERTALPERASMLYRGTAVTCGSGEAIVVATGMETELGRISALVEAVRDEPTPLERHLAALGRRLLWVTLAVAAAVVAAGALAGKGLFLMVQTGIALAVAAVPEGLPVVATIALARGMHRMARRHALVNRLASVETLGATSVVCTDKTGTLTENRMRVVRLALDGGDVEVVHAPDGADVALAGAAALLETGALCNLASFTPGTPGGSVGDPMEVALLEAAALAGIHREALVAERPQVGLEAFDPEVRMMATFHRDGGGFLVAVKGAPEHVLAASTNVLTAAGPRPLTDAARAAWRARNEGLAAEGLRVLGLALRWSAGEPDAPYQGLTLLGLAGVADPPRTDVRAAVQECRAAGIAVVMVTGDQPLTAHAVARAVGIADAGAPVMHGSDLDDPAGLPPEARDRLRAARIFARVSPKQKLRLIELHQGYGDVVAMTGDGVNDAPALRAADIGVAMGRRGTQVAREAADMVLQDDAFPTIVTAVEEGRVIFGNVRRFVLYLMSCNLSEILVVGAAAVFLDVLPIAPLQILFLNLVTDVFPALALGMGAAPAGVMGRPPRPRGEPILSYRHWMGIALYALVFMVTVLGAFAAARSGFGLSLPAAASVAFLTLGFSQVVHVFNMHGARSGWLRNEITRNPHVWGAVVLCTGLLLAVVHAPPVAEALDLVDPGPIGWAVVLTMSPVPFLAGRAVRLEL